MRFSRSIMLFTAALVGSPGCFATTADDSVSQPFQIMSQAEIDQHRRTMARLSPSEREAYRNAEYRKLRLRAQTAGYSIPDLAPWQLAAAPKTQADEPSGLPQMIEEQMQVVEQALQEQKPIAEKPAPEVTSSTPPVTPQVTEPAPAETITTPATPAPIVAVSPDDNVVTANPVAPAPAAEPLVEAPVVQAPTPPLAQQQTGVAATMPQSPPSAPPNRAPTPNELQRRHQAMLQMPGPMVSPPMIMQPFPPQQPAFVPAPGQPFPQPPMPQPQYYPQHF